MRGPIICAGLLGVLHTGCASPGRWRPVRSGSDVERAAGPAARAPGAVVATVGGVGTGPVEAWLRVDSLRREVVLEAGPFVLPVESGNGAPAGGSEGMSPAAAHHAHHHVEDAANRPKLVRFDWPVDGYLRGCRVELVDARGNSLPRHLLHHVIGLDLARRELLYHAVQRLFGAGSETGDVLLPRVVGVPVAPGDPLGIYVVWHNDTGHEVTGVMPRLTIVWTPRSPGRRMLVVLPMWMDTNNRVAGDNTFDIPPGRSTKVFEFTSPVDGRLIALGGHLHDYGTEVRLEDAETGRVITRLASEHDAAGHVTGMERRIFWLFPKRLRRGHRYRVLGVYRNPTHDSLPGAAMAHLAGLLLPDHLSQWPAIDPTHPDYREDIRTLPMLATAQLVGAPSSRSADHPN